MSDDDTGATKRFGSTNAGFAAIGSVEAEMTSQCARLSRENAVLRAEVAALRARLTIDEAMVSRAADAMTALGEDSKSWKEFYPACARAALEAAIGEGKP
jgi:hypothetical protein